MSTPKQNDQREEQEELEELVAAVLTSPRYQYVSVDLIRSLCTQELAKGRSIKETLKAVKNKVHQVGGAYLSGREAYHTWTVELQAATQSATRDDLLSVCRRIMSHHASTRERLPILDSFYRTILAELAPIHSVLDIACGLHPFAIPWMPLAEQARYYAYDIYQEMVDCLQECFPMLHVQGQARVCDVLQTCPTQQADVAFLLKAIPCLEQLDKTAGLRLLRAINAQHLVVSFPLSSLGGRGKGMLTHYEMHFRKLVAQESWSIKRFEFRGELVFLVKK